jgi:gliding motility-associated-like protein
LIKKIIHSVLLAVSLLFGLGADATHLVGGYMSYEYLGKTPNGNVRYKISVFMFRDCLSGQVDLEDRIDVGIYHVQTNRLARVITVPMIGGPRRVQPPGFTTCNFYDNNVCIERGVYETITELAPSDFGYHLMHVVCCRNVQVNLTTSADGTPNQGQTYYCRIPPTDLENSSPAFRTIPSPFICVNDTTDILYSAVDIDGDSLSYRIMHPFAGGAPTGQLWNPPAIIDPNIDAVQYKNGYNSVIPFGMDGYLNIESRTGLTSFFSRRLGSFVVGVEVLEYRNGEQIGSPIRLDLQILVLQCPPNQKPRINSGQGYEYEVEVGKELCFDIFGTDADNHNLFLEGVGEIFDGSNGYTGPRATFSQNTGRGNVSSEFCWTPGCDQARDLPYLFTITVTDDGCPSKFDSKNFSIRVKRFEGADQIDGPDRVCQGGDGYVYQAVNSKPGSTFRWFVDNGEIIGPEDESSARIRFTGSGGARVRLVEISENGCASDTLSKNVTVDANPPIPVLSGKDTICDNEILLISSSATATFQAFWDADGGAQITPGSRDASFQWPEGVLGDFTIRQWLVNATGCVSDTAIFNVHVRKPNPEVIGPQSVCPNSRDIIYNAVNTSDGSQLNWSVNGGVFSPNGPLAIAVDWGNAGTGSVSLVEIDRFGCISDAKDLAINLEYDLKGEPISGDTIVCEFDQNELYSVVSSNGSAYRWSVNGGNQISGDSSAAIRINWGAAGAAQVNYLQAAYDAVNDLWCYSDTIRLNVEIQPKPIADIINGPDSICQFEGPFTYRINGFPNSHYHWQIDGDSSDINGQGSNTVSIRWPEHGEFVLRVFETTEFGCVREWVDTLIVVHPKPTATDISGEQIFCNGAVGETYSISGFPGSTFNWWVVGGTVNSGNGSNSIDVSWDGVNPAWIQLVETSEYGCAGDTLSYGIYFDQMAVDLTVVSVGNPDNRMDIYWDIPEDAVYSGSYTIWHKELSAGAFSVLDVVEAPMQYYRHMPLNTDETPHVYRVSAVNLCGDTLFSEEHTNVRVTAARIEGTYSAEVEFSPYLGWDNGVDYYEVYVKRGDETDFSFFSTETSPRTIVLEDAVDQYKQCFRVLAFENGGELAQSWSNEVCVTFDPNVFVPNAFTPSNGDGLNDVLNVIGGAVKTFDISIYNRWGELIFEADRMDFNWDATYQGQDVPAGVYVYTLEFTDYADNIYRKSGTVHVIR